MAKILIVYSTVDGHTLTISKRLAESLRAFGNQVRLASVDDLPAMALDECNKVIVGASIRYGNYRPALLAVVKRHAHTLNGKPSAFFSVNLMARKPGRDTPETNPYIKKLLRHTHWRPVETAVFAGKLEYRHYRFLDRCIIRFIMLVTGGPTDPATVQDFTDWQKVEAFARRIAGL
ncbi:MAG TPA: menaquinone-dependent protoporphyrinogen IX dehydrogenase [Gammaproteobacteria bacterium]|nr:menaquinone-dependent protoporphyrinogen IX dehydrogenase [Gammaproteobacteria bacterium]